MGKKISPEEASNRVRRFLKRGDVLQHVFDRDVGNLLGNLNKPKRLAASIGIQVVQEDYFGQLGYNRSTHTTEYLGLYDGDDKRFDPSAPLFYEATDPRTRTFCLNDRSLEHLRILRYRYHRFSRDDIAVMVATARKIANMHRQPDGSWQGDEYDFGHFFSFLLWDIMGYPRDATPMLDQGETRHICSCYVRAILESLRVHYESIGKPEVFPRLFNIGDLTMWKLAGKLDHVKTGLTGNDGSTEIFKTPLDWTWPACFDNSHYYSNEFELIAEFKDGRIRN